MQLVRVSSTFLNGLRFVGKIFTRNHRFSQKPIDFPFFMGFSGENCANPLTPPASVRAVSQMAEHFSRMQRRSLAEHFRLVNYWKNTQMRWACVKMDEHGGCRRTSDIVTLVREMMINQWILGYRFIDPTRRPGDRRSDVHRHQINQVQNRIAKMELWCGQLKSMSLHGGKMECAALKLHRWFVDQSTYYY